MDQSNDNKFNPNLGGAFTNDKFGKDCILLHITPENFDVVMKNLQVGSAILLRFNKMTSKGNKHYFTEILPPLAGVKGKLKPASSSSDLG